MKGDASIPQPVPILIEPTKTKEDPSASQHEAAASDVRRCASLLRQMYRLEIEIYAMTAAQKDDLKIRDHKISTANALLVEIQNMVVSWGTNRDAKWTDEDEKLIREIRTVVGGMVNDVNQRPDGRK